MPDFIPGIVLCGMFYQEVVRPVLADAFPGLPYSAALIGPGSEVLGFDNALSTDHDWGPRLLLFLREKEYALYHAAIRERFQQQLPETFRGYPVRYPYGNEQVQHHVAPYTLSAFFQDFFGIDIHHDRKPADWLTVSAQELRTITSGAVYHDGVGLEAIRQQFAFYPHDLWLYLMAALWTRVGQEEHLMGRASSVGDELGAALIASRLVRDLMRICFLLERQYAPYAKWFGTAFGQLSCGPELTPLLIAVQTAQTGPEREKFLNSIYERVVMMHNTLGLTGPFPIHTTPFFDRPFRVINGGSFAFAFLARITEPTVREITQRRLIGSVEQFSDNTDLVTPPGWRPLLRQFYAPKLGNE